MITIQNQEPPEGWPRPPKFNEPGDVPGPPVQFGEAITNANVKAGYGFIPNGVEEKNLYFYHPDHLGSNSYITDKEGQIIQHTEYIAFGETFVDEHFVSNKQPYLFNGKELDFETGLYYYGARYYDPKTSIWLNVDPLAEKYPSFSPYVYTLNNPIKFIDPDGMQVWPPEDGKDGQTWSDSDGDFVNRNGTWYRDNGAFMGVLCGDCRYESVNTTNVNGTPGYDGKTMLSDSNYDYTYDLMPGKQADDINYWKNGESGVMVSRILETTARDATAVENRTTAIDAVIIVATTSGRGGGRMNNKLEPNPEAVGHHTTFKRNNSGEIYKYETYEKTNTGHFNPRKRYDGGQPNGTPGKPYVNKITGESIPTPHVQGKKIPGGARPAKTWEIPRSKL